MKLGCILWIAGSFLFLPSYGLAQALPSDSMLSASKDSVADKNLKDGQKFLELNETKPNIHVLPSGLQYEIHEEGSGTSPSLADFVVVHYRGRLIGGTEFDNTYTQFTPITVAVNAMIPGWVEALQLMKPGARWTLYLPPKLAYGKEGAGHLIGPNSALIYDIELLEIKTSLDEDSLQLMEDEG